MRIVLVHMPWAPIDIPSLALGILRTAAERAGHEVQVRYANVDWVDWLTERADFDLAAYHYYSDESYFSGAGDWIFSRALYQPDEKNHERFIRLLARDGASREQIERTVTLSALAPDFVEWLASQLDRMDPDMVGFTTTFQQNTASLVVARLLKRRRPSVWTVFGGANCDGAQGAALHRNFPFIDFVVRGEGECAFPALLDVLTTGVDDGAQLATVPGLCWRSPDGTPVVNPMARRPLPPGAILPPTFDGFFERLEASAASAWVEPRLVVEGARGCWWGQKHHCTFCGLNGSFMEFRSKHRIASTRRSWTSRAGTSCWTSSSSTTSSTWPTSTRCWRDWLSPAMTCDCSTRSSRTCDVSTSSGWPRPERYTCNRASRTSARTCCGSWTRA